jgi:tetratricopeptide (TPR) repeat protein
MCQWLPLYGMDAESVRSVVKTFATVFPHITLWANPSAATSLLIGTNQPISIDVASLARRFERPPVRADLARIEAVHPWTLLAGFLFNEQAVAAYANAAPLNTDDRPLLEFAAPKALYLDTHTYPANLLALLAHRKAMQPYLSPATGPVAEAFQHLVSATGATLEGWANVRLGREREGEALFERVLRDYPDNPTARGELAHILVKRGLAATSNGNLAEAKATLERSIRLSPSSQAHLALGNVYYMGQHWEAATSQYRLTLHFKPESAVAHKSLSYALIMEGSKEGEARDHLLRALALNPTDPEAKQLRELADRLSKAKAASTP